ncbi:hypothetical protein BV902_02220 [Sphingobacterium sp. B29]|uniref:polysaccharide pyruvyl transferase family protein n=1 Tax=Sphingobacterium sp. B29 TaxID=1933220 RepID=UPI0009588A64|nr:polysaccharide pyruvyl transferase family protein [Sphingobacterium sp. B29]APU95292.1 hypothetical protein BV902_02220 [Sphingobacterium sp. B29]
MNIQIDGINTQNKGAELMLVAILEEIEQRVPNATVWLNPNGTLDMSMLPNYKLNIKQRFFLKRGRIFRAILRRIGLSYSYFTHFHARKGIDIMLDASGFQFSDQWKHSDKTLKIREEYYKQLKGFATKIVLMPQAFGPFETENGKKSVHIISKYFDLIFARERQSYNFLIKAGADVSKVSESCDFTLKVKGEVPQKYLPLKGKACIIPNKKMITHTNDGKKNYLLLMDKIIKTINEQGMDVFLLNHEGDGDFKLCEEINLIFNNKLTIVSDLRAKEVKGVIGISSLVVSSRFHGVASALSQGVPCLATSWNHKYEMLFNDFGQENTILRANDIMENNIDMVKNVLIRSNDIKKVLIEKKEERVRDIDIMWSKIFS